VTSPEPTEGADPRTAAELAERIDALVHFTHDGGEDSYSRSADAMWQAALLAFEYAAREVGATGFQASWAAMRFLGEALHIDGPYGLVKAEHCVYPQYDEVAKVRGWIEGEWRQWIADKAREHLAKDNPFAVDEVKSHWRRLADATPPDRQLGSVR